jgi:hypothetical protein
MLPREIDKLVERTFAVIAKGNGNGKNTKYFFQAESDLSPQEWQAFNRRLNELGLTSPSIAGAIELNAQGFELAKTGGYQEFLKGHQKKQNDSLKTNLFTRRGVWIAGAALVVAVVGTYIAWLTLVKPDTNEASTKKLQASQKVDSTELANLKNRVDTLAQHHRSIIHTDTVSRHPASPPPSKPQSHAPAASHRHVPTGRLTPSK